MMHLLQALRRLRLSLQSSLGRSYKQKLSFVFVAAAAAGTITCVAAAAGTRQPLENSGQVSSGDKRAPDQSTRGDESTGRSSGHGGATTSSNATDLSVTLNGKQLSVPADGQLHKHYEDSNGTTDIDVTHQSSGQSSTSLNISLHSSSQTNVGGSSSQ